MKVILIISISFIMISSIFADGVQPIGTGTEADPYQVETLDNLLWISTNPTSWTWNNHFIQTEDIDASDTQNWNNGEGFSPIGLSDGSMPFGTPFVGSYNGQEHIINYLYCNVPDNSYIGFFGKTENATISNLGIVNVNITAGGIVGGLAGYHYNSSIENCFSTGNVTGSQESIGGLVGSNSYSTIFNCYSTCSVSGSHSVGGLVGTDISNSSTIHNSYSTGNISSSMSMGGLVGSSNEEVINSFYNFESVLINGVHTTTRYALTNELFTDWLSNDLSLNIEDYFEYSADYYLVNSLDDFKNILGFTHNSDYQFKLTNDIDLIQEPDFYIPYTASNIDGDGHTILNINIDQSYNRDIGLFGKAEGASISNINVENVNIIGNQNVGCLVGNNRDSSLENCISSGSVIGTGLSYVGGLVGYNYYSSIENCSSSGSIIGIELWYVGGLVGCNYFSGIENCYSSCNVQGVMRVGGLVGSNSNSSIILNSYSVGSIIGGFSSGGLVGENYGNIENSFFDYESVLINGSHRVSPFALTNELFTDWLNNDLTLNIEDYFEFSENNYLIDSITDFKNLLGFSNYSDYSFRLTNNINLIQDPDFFIPNFNGAINGDEYTISNLYINQPDQTNIGLFGNTEGALICSLRVENVNVNGKWFVGSLVGFNSNTNIENCTSTNSVCSASSYVGGLVGQNEDSDIINSNGTGNVNGYSRVGGLVGKSINSTFNNCSFSGSTEGSGPYIGGLIGYSTDYSQIICCFSSGIVSGAGYIGGLVGYNVYFSSIMNCYSTSNVVGSGGLAGGLVGYSDFQNNYPAIQKCYSTGSVSAGGGLVGSSVQFVSNSFWDIETSGQIESGGGTGKTTAEMLDVATYTETSTQGLNSPWDFVGNPFDDIANEDIWDIDDNINNGYPYLVSLYTGVNDDEIIIIDPVTPKLIGNYPNPFNPETSISFFIPDDSKVKLTIYNIKGQNVKTIANNLFEKGVASVLWSGNDYNGKLVGSGVYFYKLIVNGKTEAVKKCLLLK